MSEGRKDGDLREGDGLVPADLLEILRCPFEDCRQCLQERVAERLLVCQGCGRGYRVDDLGTPNLLCEEAIPPDEVGAAP